MEGGVREGGRVIATGVGFGICCWRDDKGEQLREASKVCRFGLLPER
jgi:hypothetical protein